MRYRDYITIALLAAFFGCSSTGTSMIPDKQVLAGILIDELGYRIDKAYIRPGNGTRAAAETSDTAGQFSIALNDRISSGITLTIDHPWYTSVDTSMAAAGSDTLIIYMRYKRLSEGEYFRVLAPDSGDVVPYGSDLTIAWLQDASVSSAAVVSVSSDGGLTYRDIPSDAQEWNQYPRDLNGDSKKSYRNVDTASKCVIGFYRITMRDTVNAMGPFTFAGSQMKVRVWEPYPSMQPGAVKLRDVSNGFFMVEGHP